MILGNLMLGTTGRPWNSFVTMDVMRLPLGILTGMGFIGAGAILHRANMVTGVTTAATLWFTTLMGFCFGAGEFLLGAWMLGLGVFVLWCMQWIEARWKQQQEATLMVLVDPDGPTQVELTALIETDGHKVSSCAARYAGAEREWRFRHPLARRPGGCLLTKISGGACRALGGSGGPLDPELKIAVISVVRTESHCDVERFGDTRDDRTSLDMRVYGLQYILYHWRDRCRRINSQASRIVLVLTPVHGFCATLAGNGKSAREPSSPDSA